MCGRYTVRSIQPVAELFGISLPPEFQPRYNVAPTQDVLVVRSASKEQTTASRRGDLLRWGMVPSWADDPSVGNRMINARAETAATRLALPDVFYFGNLPGETGDDPAAADVDAADVVLTREALHEGSVDVTSRFDFDRNGRVDARDMAIVRGAAGDGALQLIGPVALPAVEAAPTSRRDFRPIGATSLLFDADATGAQ